MRATAGLVAGLPRGPVRIRLCPDVLDGFVGNFRLIVALVEFTMQLEIKIPA